MSEKTVSTAEKRSPGKLVLPSLIFSGFAIQPPGILTGLLLIDIGATFGCSVGVIGQIRTVSSIVAVVSALLMGVLSVRFRHRSLLLMGLLSVSISAVACCFSSDFNMILVSYSISGLGMAMVAPMTYTLVAEYFPLEKRATAIGWIIAGMALSYFVGAPVIAIIEGLGGWRLAFLGFVLPVSVFSLLLAAKGVPPIPSSKQRTVSRRDYMEGFKGVFSNRSADACLIGTALSMAAWQAILLYSSSFRRQRFLISTGFASILMLIAAFVYTLGTIGSGRVARKVGMKTLTFSTAFLAGIFVITYTSPANLWLSVALSFLGCLFSGMLATASTSLTLEQVPKFRGTMMSMNSAVNNTGSALGAGIGGAALLLFNYEGMAVSLGAMGIAAAIVFQLLAKDPTKTEVQMSS